MWKLILKNLWSRRKRNGWLLAELVLVSVVTWVIIDPVVVILYDKSLPTGYDEGQLCLVDVATVDRNAPQFDAQAADSASSMRHLLRLADKVRTRPEVENVAPLLTFAYMESQGNMNRGFENDSLKVQCGYVYFVPGQHYFETYGFRPMPGSPSAEELSSMAYAEREMIVTRSLAQALFPDGNALGRTVNMGTGQEGYRIVGVLDDVRAYTTRRDRRMAFCPQTDVEVNSTTPVLVRLKPGVSPERFLHEFRPWMVGELRSGNLFARTAVSYPQLIRDYEYGTGVTNRMRLNLALALFFLTNLCLGVIGTFWLQTRKRREEAGVMRSFGATPSSVVRLLLGEGVALTSVAFVLGCAGYLQYALKEGLSNGANWGEVLTDDWVSQFGTHFAGVSLVVYVVLLAVVSVGIYIPARGISRVNPVDALRDE